MTLHLRSADAGDADFIAEMLVVAAFWRPDGPRGSVEVVADDPNLWHYVAGWPRAGDLGVVAQHDAERVGAAWLRLLPEDEPGFGFVDAATPEMAIGVHESWRGQGIGARLLRALIAAASDAGHQAVSLSVEHDNPARRLYERVGFGEVRDNGALTMVLPLSRTRPRGI